MAGRVKPITEEHYYSRGLALMVYGVSQHASTWAFRDETRTIPLGAVEVKHDGSYCTAKWADVCRAR